MKRLCDDCRHEIKAAAVCQDRRHFCDSRCRENWKRRMARFFADREKPVAFGDA
jgi:hypothetical protein